MSFTARAEGARALILAGGSGTRLWPRSTDAHPKPFLALAGNKTLLRETFDRAERLVGPGGVYLSARSSHADLVRRELPELSASRLLLEPLRRNTAPAIALSALAIAEEAPDATLVVLPSDPAVRDEEAFLRALRKGIQHARENDVFVTVGIPPTRPETGFGYLDVEAGPAFDESASHIQRVRRFVEKPGVAEAERYIAEGFLWNAGIFMFRVSLLLREMKRLCPEVLASAGEALAALRKGDREGFLRAFSACPSISIDYAVMERSTESPGVATIACSCGWSDLGSWEAVYDFRAPRSAGHVNEANVVEGAVSLESATGNLILADGKPIRVLGLHNVVIVDAPEGLLVMRKGDSDLLRKAVEKDLSNASADSAARRDPVPLEASR